MKFQRFLIFLIGVASAFNTAAINTGGRPLSVGLLATAAYFVGVVPFMSRSLVRNTIKSYGRFVFLPLAFCLLLTFVNMLYSGSARGIFPFSVFMDWILMLVILFHSRKDSNAVDFCLYGFSLGATILSVLFYLGIGVDVSLVDRAGERMSMFGSNENILGIIQTFNVAVVLIAFIIEDRFNLRLLRFVFIIPLVLSITMIMATGSRTALLILVGILVVTVSFLQIKTQYKLLIIIVSVFAGFYLVNWFLSADMTIVTRVLWSIEDGNTGGRTDIWNAYLKYFPEHPIIGVGSSGLYDIALRSGIGTITVNGVTQAFSPHNVFVEVLMETGLIGFLFMGVFWFKSFVKARCGLKLYKAELAVVIIVPIIVVLMSGQLLTEKYAWFSYAYMIASSCGCVYSKKTLN